MADLNLRENLIKTSCGFGNALWDRFHTRYGTDAQKQNIIKECVKAKLLSIELANIENTETANIESAEEQLRTRQRQKAEEYENL